VRTGKTVRVVAKRFAVVVNTGLKSEKAVASIKTGIAEIVAMRKKPAPDKETQVRQLEVQAILCGVTEQWDEAVSATEAGLKLSHGG
jgi:hypothetical protein